MNIINYYIQSFSLSYIIFKDNLFLDIILYFSEFNKSSIKLLPFIFCNISDILVSLFELIIYVKKIY